VLSGVPVAMNALLERIDNALYSHMIAYLAKPVHGKLRTLQQASATGIAIQVPGHEGSPQHCW
jgi:hypothetical protein